MIASNVERNKLISGLWEKGLTVDQISSMSGIPRSTIGYYVRKFNRLAAKGEPVVFPSTHSEVSRDSPLHFMNDWIVQQYKVQAYEWLCKGEFERLYYFLMDLKLLKEFGFLITEKDHRKALSFLGLK